MSILAALPGIVGAGANVYSALDQPEQPSGPDLLDPWNIINFLALMMAGNQQQAAFEQAQESTLARYAQGLGVLQDAMEGGMATYDAESQRALDQLLEAQGYSREQRRDILEDFEERMVEREAGYARGTQDFLTDFQTDWDRIRQGYTDRYATAEEDIAQYGQQMRADIDRYFEDQEGQVVQDLISRGLASSSEGARQLLSTTERQTAEQRRLGEDLLRARINTLAGLSGEGLLADERLLGTRSHYQSAANAYEAALAGDTATMLAELGRWDIGEETGRAGDLANFFQTTAINRSNLFGGGMRDIANWMGSMTALPPPVNPALYSFAQTAGQAAAPLAQYPGQGAALGQGLGMGTLGTSLETLTTGLVPLIQRLIDLFTPEGAPSYGWDFLTPERGWEDFFGPNVTPPTWETLSADWGTPSFAEPLPNWLLPDVDVMGPPLP